MPVDGVTETTVGRLAALFAAAGSAGGRKPQPPPLLPSRPGLQTPASPPMVVTVRQALETDALPSAETGLPSPLPLLCSAPLVTMASWPNGEHASASAAEPSCAAAVPPGLEVSGRQPSADSWVETETASATQPCCENRSQHVASKTKIMSQCCRANPTCHSAVCSYNSTLDWRRSSKAGHARKGVAADTLCCAPAS